MMTVGQTFTASAVVTPQMLALTVGSGDLRVLATPAMIALMENAAMHCVKGHLSEGDTTVGSLMQASHLRPTPEGATITATATLTAIEGRKLTFAVVAADEQGSIGEGTHVRYVVTAAKFMAKLA